MSRRRLAPAGLLIALAGCHPSSCGAFLSPPDAVRAEQPESVVASAPAGELFVGAASVELAFEDAVWLGGFGFFRASEGQLDPITARAIALRRGAVTALVIGCDVVGLHHYQVETVRERLADVASRDAILVAATHTHSGPDTLGMWGALPPLCSGLEDEVVDTVLVGIEAAARQAVARLQPARVRWGAAQAPEQGVSKNLRSARIDRTVTAVAFERPGGERLATLVHFAAHPEALGSDNDLISADFAAGLYAAMEDGGGVCVYLNGAIGGLITTDATGTSPEEVLALGGRVAAAARAGLARSTPFPPAVDLHAVRRPLWLPIQNRRFHLGQQFGIFGPRVFEGGHTRSEVLALAVGPLVLVTAPGEIEPRLANELSAANPGRPGLLVGLGGDELGYFLHEAEFDEERFAYERTVSPGPLASVVLRKATREVLAELAELRGDP